MHRLGFVLQGLNLWDAMRVMGYLQTRQDVLADRIGCTDLYLDDALQTADLTSQKPHDMV